MTVTTIPVGTTGQSLEGWEVNGAVRESVVLSDPNASSAVAEIVSSQPIEAYGLPVWVQGTPSVAIAGTVVVDPTSTQIVSSIPFYVAQSSAPWDMRGGVAVTNTPNVSVTALPNIRGGVNVSTIGTVSTQIVSSIPFFVSQSSSPWTVNISTMPGLGGTTMVNVVSSIPQTVNVTVTANQITSSIPFFVAQSSAPWSVIGGVQVTNVPTVNVTNVPLVTVQGTSSVNVISSAPHAIVGTVSTQVISSIPFFVAQSTAVWTVSPYATTAGGGNMTTVVCAAGLNATVIKAAAGQIYSVNVSYFGSSQAFVKLANNSTAVSVSTAVTKMLIGLQSSTNIAHSFPVGSEYTTGIVMYTIRTPFAAGSGTTGILASSMTVSICYE